LERELREPPERDEVERELLLREPVEREVDLERELDPLREPPDERDDVDFAAEERELLLRELEDPEPERARVAAPLRAAVLRLAAARLRVAAPFFAAAERDLALLPPRTLLSRSSASPRSSSTALRTSFDELSPASAIARAVRLRIPLARSFLNRSLSSDALAIPFSPPEGVAGRSYFYPPATEPALRFHTASVKRTRQRATSRRADVFRRVR
jgi:hypothetical protein